MSWGEVGFEQREDSPCITQGDLLEIGVSGVR